MEPVVTKAGKTDNKRSRSAAAVKSKSVDKDDKDDAPTKKGKKDDDTKKEPAKSPAKEPAKDTAK